MSVQENAQQLLVLAEQLPIGPAEAVSSGLPQEQAQSTYHQLGDFPGKIVYLLGEMHADTPELSGMAALLLDKARELAELIDKAENDAQDLAMGLHQLGDRLHAAAERALGGN